MITEVASVVNTALTRFFPDKEKLAEVQSGVTMALISAQAQLVTAAASVVRAEAGSAHFLTATWRPITMLALVAIVVNNYILAPYVLLFFDVKVSLEVPPDLWDLIKIGLGGYVVGRSAEKIAETINAKR